MADKVAERVIDYLLAKPDATRSELNAVLQLAPGQLSSVIFRLKNHGVIDNDLKLLRSKYTGDLKLGIMSVIKPSHNKENCLNRTKIAMLLLAHEADVRRALRELFADGKVQAVKNNNGYILPQKTEAEYLALASIVLTKPYPIDQNYFYPFKGIKK
ncbi:hypothetical protein IHC87_06645 [Photobacterium damselae subsp. damselae]|uniref:hypothetical protein n=1 Tax=Photobacterium damselae TaxID=38293 RepID=UPI001F3C0D33|nr:hypothetical protein [Photobacterium damselae]UJZ95018.1 hypothetical protein IHC87_06645 [Photobacterium damselae subsp. damselae]UJZ98999.1 hypothetical protein IHC88_06635 [Photobacterium damselae subsp. damselae]